MEDTTAPVVSSTRELSSRLLAANPPKIDGIIPGSIRRVLTTVDGNNGATLRSGKTYNMIALQELSGNRATLGGQAELVVRGVAKKSDGTDILVGDNVSLREEAPTLLWRNLQLKVNNTILNQCERADVVRHTIDRLFTSSERNTHTDRGPYTYRQLGQDVALEQQDVSTHFKKTNITDGKTFELIRPLDDLPLLGAHDGIIPGFLSVTLDATLGDVSNIFASAPAALGGSPRIEIETIEIRTRTVALQTDVAIELERMWAAGELRMNADTWTATQAPPQIAAGSTKYSIQTALAFSSVPDILAFMMFSADSFTPSAPVYEQPHPLIHTWNGIDRFEIKEKGECIQRWEDLNATKSLAFASVVEAIETPAGTHPGTSGPWTKGTLDSRAFDEGTTGSLVLAYRNWGERSAHELTPIDLRVDATFSAPTIETVSLYAVSKIRHLWQFSAVSGGTRLA